MARLSKESLGYSFEALCSESASAQKHMERGRAKENWMEYWYYKGQYEAYTRAASCFVELSNEYEELKRACEDLRVAIDEMLPF